MLSNRSRRPRLVFTLTLLIAIAAGLVAFTGGVAAVEDTVSINESVEGPQTDFVGNDTVVYVRVEAGSKSSGTDTVNVTGDAQDNITVPVYDDGNGDDPDGSAGDGVYWGNFSISDAVANTDGNGVRNNTEPQQILVTEGNNATVFADIDNDGPEGTASVIADYSSPSSVSISNPTDGDVTQSQDLIEGSATDSPSAGNISAVNVTIQRYSDDNYWDGSSWTSSQSNVSADPTDGNFDDTIESWEYDSSSITGDDTYNVTATAIDGADNTNESVPLNYTIDTTAPTVSIDTPNDGDRVQSQDYINGSSMDTNNITGVNLTIQRDSDNQYWNDTSSSWEGSETNISANATDDSFDSSDEDWFFDSSAITSDDTYTVTAEAIDEANNTATDEISYTLYTPSSSSSSSSSGSSSSSTKQSQYRDSKPTKQETRSMRADRGAGTSTVTFSSGSDVESITFDSTSVSGSVTVRKFSSEPSGVSRSPGRTVSITEISVPDNARTTSATIRKRVSMQRLAEVDADASELRINRYNDAEDEWTTLSTEVAAQNSDRVVISAKTPGFSLFSVSAIDEDTSGDEEDETDTDADNETETDTEETDDSAEETSDGIPGFGVAVSLVALVATALFARRRQS